MPRKEIIDRLYAEVIEYAHEHPCMTYSQAMQALLSEYMEVLQYGIDLLSSPDNNRDWLCTIHDDWAKAHEDNNGR